MPSPEARAARRELLTRLLTHGSGGGSSSTVPLSAVRTSEGAAHGNTATTVVFTRPSPSPPEREDTGAVETAAYEAVHPESWTTPQLTTFLEAHRVPGGGINAVITKAVVGADFLEIIQDSEAHQMLSEILQVTERFDRLQLISRFKSLVKKHNIQCSASGTICYTPCTSCYMLYTRYIAPRHHSIPEYTIWYHAMPYHVTSYHAAMFDNIITY